MKIDGEKLRLSLTDEEIISLMEYLGCEKYKDCKEYIAFSTSVCHKGNSLKLVYFKRNKNFYCFTDCSCSYDIYSLVKKNRGYSYKEAIDFVAKYVGKKFIKEEIDKNLVINDWKWLKRLSKKDYEEYTLPILNKEILKQFVEIPHIQFFKEGIDCKTQQVFRVGFSLQFMRITIPIFDDFGRLVGVKGRIIRELEGKVGEKYIAIYPYNKSSILYGLHKTLPYILEKNEVIILESEKSVLKLWSMGYKNAVAIAGKTVSEVQKKKIIGLNCSVVWALDNDVTANEMKKIVNENKMYVKQYVVWDKWNKLEDKDAPCDKGKEVWEFLYNNRFAIK